MSNLTIEKLPKNITRNLSRNLCVCYDVPRKQVIEAILHGAETLEEVSQKTYACQGSGCCVGQVERLIEQIVGLSQRPELVDETSCTIDVNQAEIK